MTDFQLGLFGEEPEPESQSEAEGEVDVAADTSPVDAASDDRPSDPDPLANQSLSDGQSLLEGIAGQAEATQRLRAALETPVPSYLFVGPAGVGIDEIARRFAGELLARGSSDPARQRRQALEQQHPDLIVFERLGPYLSAEQARDAVSQASKPPFSCSRKVLVLHDLHLAQDTAAILLKAVEEASPTTVFLLLAEQVPPHLLTLASRSVRIDFVPLNEATIAEILRAEGVPEERLAVAASSAGGSIDRARLLASDDAALHRVELWKKVLGQLNGSGAKAAELADELLEAIDASGEPLKRKHSQELEEQAERFKRYALPASSGSTAERQRRELRRQMMDELKMGFAVLCEEIRTRSTASEYNANETAQRLRAVHRTSDTLRHNVNPRLALQHLMLQIGPSA